MPDRWFLVPRATQTRAAGSTGHVPKYSERVEGYTGRIIEKLLTATAGYDEPLAEWETQLEEGT